MSEVFRRFSETCVCCGSDQDLDYYFGGDTMCDKCMKQWVNEGCAICNRAFCVVVDYCQIPSGKVLMPDGRSICEYCYDRILLKAGKLEESKKREVNFSTN